MKYKLLGILFIILVILAIASFVYYWQTLEQADQYFQPVKHNNATANWRTYTNIEYEFSLDLPQGYTLTENKTRVVIKSPACLAEINDGYAIEKDCFMYDILIQKNKIGIAESIDAIEVAGYPAEKFEIKDGMYNSMNQIYAQFKKDEFWYINFISFNSGNRTAAVNMFNRILSTFKFTQGNPIDPS